MTTPVEYLMTQTNVHWTYLRLLVLPINQNLDYDYPISRTLFEIPTIFSFIGYMGLWAAGLYYWKRRPVISFNIFWFIITLSPVSSILPFNNVISEHRMYLPSIGIFVAVSTCVYIVIERLKDRWEDIGKTAVVICSVIILVLTGVTYARNTVWKDGVTLWEDAASKSPNKARVHNNLGMAYGYKGEIDKAMEHLEIAINIQPNNVEPHYNLGLAYLYKGNTDLAIIHFETALKLKPDYADAYNNLGVSLEKKGFVDKAIAEYKTAIKLDPYNFRAHINLGNVYQSQSLFDKAREHYETAKRLKKDKEIQH